MNLNLRGKVFSRNGLDETDVSKSASKPHRQRRVNYQNFFCVQRGMTNKKPSKLPTRLQNYWFHFRISQQAQGSSLFSSIQVAIILLLCCILSIRKKLQYQKMDKEGICVNERVRHFFSVVLFKNSLFYHLFLCFQF